MRLKENAVELREMGDYIWMYVKERKMPVAGMGNTTHTLAQQRRE